jgi:cyclic nucleotide gated channel
LIQVYKEGNPVKKMHFVSRGHFESSYRLNDNDYSLSILGPGTFCGDELLSWALRQPHVEIFPPSTATLKSLDVTEVFSLDASDLKYVTDHYRYKFETETLRRAVRFYSLSWRMWAALTIQIAWRRCKFRLAAKAALAVVRSGGKIGPPPKDDEEILGLLTNSNNRKPTDSNKRGSKSLTTVPEETDQDTESMEGIHEQHDTHMPDTILPSSVSTSPEQPD